MITKENNKKISIDTNNQNQLDIEELNRKYSDRWKIANFTIITLFVILTLVVIYILKIYNMNIYNPYETRIIQVKSENKDWILNENINIFNFSNGSGESIIWPGQSGSYEFVLQNNNNIPIKYKIELSENNKDNINMKYRLKLDNIYIAGDENNYVSIDKLNFNNITILEKTKSKYTLEWKWEESDLDTELGKTGLATFRIYIDIYSKSIGEGYENFKENT